MNKPIVKVSAVMSRRVVTVKATTPVTKIARILWSKGFSGVPVVDTKNRVIGIVTEYDLISQKDRMHIPSFIALLEILNSSGIVSRQSERLFGHLKKLTAADIMTKDPFCIAADLDLNTVAKIFVNKKFNPLPVVDKKGKLVGIIARSDLVKILQNFKF